MLEQGGLSQAALYPSCPQTDALEAQSLVLQRWVCHERLCRALPSLCSCSGTLWEARQEVDADIFCVFFF